MKVTVVYSPRAHTAFKIAAETFSCLAKKVSGSEVLLITDREELPLDDSLVVVIGADSQNHLAADLYLKREIGDFGFVYNTDAYRIFTKTIDGRNYLFIAGARPRATLYAVWRYFEKFCSCRWFWDGDRVPEGELVVDGIDLFESPRFEYRGLRYFAHRSLHRFQAEHWSLEDWQREIDWMLKKRLNMFMLRIGNDDIFQKAFPDIVPYPELNSHLPESGIEHHDRDLFWSLEYRGELRKKLLQYAFERDLIHPEDCGTITHWYSRTPRAYLEKVNPKLLHSSKYNGDVTGQVWDVLDDDNLENYFKLTDTHVKEYGKPEMFHTIGLAERSFSSEREENMRLKLYVYRRISARLKEKYPNAPLLIASWDLWMFYTAEEVERLLNELDPSQAIILDYTSDTMTRFNFTNWGVMGKFPWIFGMFSAYQPDNEIRGFYEHTAERLKLAKADPMCKGMIFWPELSHGDTFAIEYFARNAWDSDTISLDESIERYCNDRYSPEKRDAMLEIWREFMPIVQMRSWSPSASETMFSGQNTFPWMIERATFEDKPFPHYGRDPEIAQQNKKSAMKVLSALMDITPDDDMLRRDVCDIARTVISRYLDCAIRLAEVRYLRKDKSFVDVMDGARSLMISLWTALCSHEDFSLLETLKGLREVTETSENFEKTLKHNAEGYYCRSYISENVSHLYLPEMDIIFDEVKLAFEREGEIDRERIKNRIAENIKRYHSTPLSEMQPTEKPDISKAIKDALETIAIIDFEE